MRAGVAGLALTAGSARADAPVFLQWFETRWSTMEYRIPDFFMAGYDSTWIPPIFKAADPTSAGFDTFDRFDLGSPGSETAYGTQAGLQAVIDEFHYASALVYPDLVMNHNSGRNNSDDFFNAGGYPGFVMRRPGDFWGDFNDGSTQSYRPQDSNYNLWNGDLVGLIDIAHEKNYQFIRQPTTPGNAQNIPAGTVRNRPDPNNARFYPDLSLPGTVVNNPGRPAAPGTDIPPRSSVAPFSTTIYPYNLASPMSGDPVVENSTAYLLRSTQWLLEVIRIDGFRLDAAKHIPHWFWDQYWDTIVFNRRRTFAGGLTTPFSFGEVVASNDATVQYTRKDGFGNRDALDLNGAGQLRDLLNSGGFGTWQNVLNAHLDTADDGFNNGSLGVNHVFSHDNGSTGDGGSAPPLPGPERWGLVQHAYVLLRPGPVIIYHNSREFIDRYQFRGFWPREGNPSALGAPDQNLVRLVQVANQYARGEFTPRNSIINDAFVFERRRVNGPGLFEGNLIVGVNDSFLSGSVTFNVYTSFPAGTRLHELTGTATDPLVDPNNQVPDVIVTQAFNPQNPSIPGAQSWMTITVPYNRNINGVTHHRGYVAYGPAVPTGTFTVRRTDGSAFTNIIPADGPAVPSYRRRLTPITVVDTPSFEIRLTTNKTDPADPAWDDFAAFRIDAGFPSAGTATDFNDFNNGPDFGDADPFIPRFETFRTEASPLFNSTRTNGLYRQTIDTSRLSEGLHYIRAVAFRNRPSNTDPLFGDFRQVIYVDRVPPPVTLLDAAAPITTPINTFRVVGNDRTAQRVWILLNVPGGTDPLTLLNTPGVQASQWDRNEWRRTISGLRSGANTVTVVAEEVTGRRSVTNFNVTVTVGSGDINRDGTVDLNDLYAGFAALSVATPAYDPAGDINSDSQFNTLDLRLLEQLIRPVELRNMQGTQR
jgi:hypothetical protein